MSIDWKRLAAEQRAEQAANGHRPRILTTEEIKSWKPGAESPAPDPEPDTITSAFPDPPAKEAFHGLAADLVHTLDPHTEASSVALLLQMIVAFGNVIGRTAHFRADGVRHYCNLFAVAVGATAKGRKGTSWARVREPFWIVEQAWIEHRNASGLSSGEGLIWAVRDPITKREPVKEKGRVTGYQEVEVDAGESDKRLFVQEPEFANVLKQTERNGNTLSAIIRQAWESGNIRSLTKNSPARTTDAHISIVGHITADELRRYLSTTEAASGFGNRFLWIAVKRSKLLPDGGGVINLESFNKRIGEAISFARQIGEMPRDDEARELWHEVYPKLSAERPGLLGAMLARAEPQTMRMACIYALLDGSYQVEAKHLQAALALWDYCERSTAYIFGNSTGDQVADEIMAALKRCKDGLSRTDIRELFHRNHSSARIGQALLVLELAGLANREVLQTNGRPAEIWRRGRTR